MKPLIFAPAALDDLDGIAEYIGADNPERAVTFVAELEAKAMQAAKRLRSFPTRDDVQPGLRSIVHRSYLILFRETAEEVRIVHIVHGRRNLHALSFN